VCVTRQNILTFDILTRQKKFAWGTPLQLAPISSSSPSFSPSLPRFLCLSPSVQLLLPQASSSSKLSLILYHQQLLGFVRKKKKSFFELNILQAIFVHICFLQEAVSAAIARDVWFNKVDVHAWLQAFSAHPTSAQLSSS
jgi:hypothetical protein